jgi:hypothetical protein
MKDDDLKAPVRNECWIAFRYPLAMSQEVKKNAAKHGVSIAAYARHAIAQLLKADAAQK